MQPTATMKGMSQTSRTGQNPSNKRKNTNSPSNDSSSSSAVMNKKKKAAKGDPSKPPKHFLRSSDQSQTDTAASITVNPPVNDEESMSTFSEDDITSSKTPKSIFVSSHVGVIRNTLQSLTLKVTPEFKFQGSKATQIKCANQEDKKKVIEELKKKQFQFHSHSEPDEKPKVFVLKGFYKVSSNNPSTANVSSSQNSTSNSDEMLKILVENGIPAKKVSMLCDSEEFPSYLVHFDPTTNIRLLQHNHKIVDQVIIRWSALNRNKKRPVQCHNCQLWGHSSQNCNRPFRCVKCNSKHKPGECERKTRDGTVKCCNCNGDHAANFLGCPSQLKYQETINSQRIRSSRKPSVQASSSYRTQIPEFSNDNFPHLNSSREAHPCSSSTNHWTTNSQKVSASCVNSNSSPLSQNLEKNFHEAKSFWASPSMQNTMKLFVEMTEKLKAAQSQAERLTILMKYQSFTDEV